MLPDLNDLRVGAALRWQDEVSVIDLEPVTQDAYAVLDLMAGVGLTDHLRATLNINNATDEKHLTSLMWNQFFYAEPRSVFVSLAYAF